MNRTLNAMRFLAFLCSFLVSAAFAAAPTPPKLDTTAYILIDYDSGAVLAEDNPDKPVEPASLTKIMTSYVVYQELAKGELKLEDEVTISEKAWKMGGSRMFIEVNTKVSVDDLLHGLVIQSGNDASVALAEHIAGTETGFADMMNRAAKTLGMNSSYFRNATGWPAEGHIVTARDMATLTRAMIREFPDRYRLYAQKSYTYNKIPQHNRNKLLWRDDSVDGVKTGHTEAAGYCLVSSAKRDGQRLISVVTGTKSEKSRADASQALLNWGYRFYETHKIYDKDSVLEMSPVWKGDTGQVGIGPGKAVYISVPRGRYKDLNAEMAIDSPLLAPLTKGQHIGQLRVTLEGDTIAEQPIVTLNPVAVGGIFGRMIDSIRLMF